jgi:beta-lactamase class A
MTIARRQFVAGALATGLVASGCARPLGETIEDGLSYIDPPEFSPAGRFLASLRRIEGEADGTLGAELYEVGSARAVGLNRERRFGHCSSFKLSLAAMVLARDASGIETGDTRVTWSEADLMFVSPFTKKRLADGASLLELAEYTQKYSDNAAANILLRRLGGPGALTAFWRSIGDPVSRLDRYEPQLNDVPVTEYRDTTTPSAMARTVATLVYGDVLPDASRALLRQWMIDTPTGARRVRAGLPEGWVAGDKTGTSIWPGIRPIYADIGFVEPPDDEDFRRGPFTFATYFRPRLAIGDIDPAAETTLARVGEVLSDFAEEPDKWPW